MPDPKTRPVVAAIGAMLDALEPLDEHARLTAIQFVLTQLRISIGGLPSTTVTPERAPPPALHAQEPSTYPQPAPVVMDIRMLKELKKPRSANEMAALVAYYLKHEAPSDARKETISAKDINKYFDQAKYPLPASAMTLTNSKNAGYLDSAGRNQFKLNAVGYNLVVHRLPAHSDAPAARLRRTNKTARKRAPQKKKTR